MMLGLSVQKSLGRTDVASCLAGTALRVKIVAAILLCVPLLAGAAGLGRLTVLSVLGQPLNAEIEIVSLQPGEDDSLSARLANPEAFRQAGIDLNPSLIGVRFTVERRDGKPFLRLTTTQPINDPFLDILVEVQWATGRLVREYTFLLDPPQYKAAPAAAPAPAPPPAAAKPEPVAEPPKAAPPPSVVEQRPIQAAAPAKSAGTHEVKKGDTLGAIARANKPDGVTLNQMLIALYRANREAFIRDNINLVRAGRILNSPDREAIAGVDAEEAKKLVMSQMEDFAEYRRKLGAIAAAAPGSAAPAQREVQGRITPKPEEPAPSAQKDQLRLSKAEPGKPGAAGPRAARGDDRVAQDRALKEAQSRVSDLEKNVGDLQKLLEIKNQQLAQLEKKEPPKPAPPAAAPKPSAEAPKPAAEAPKPAAEAPKPAAEAPKPAAEAPKPAPEAPKPAAEAPKAAVEAAKPAAEGAKPAAEAPKPAAEAAKPAAEAPKAAEAQKEASKDGAKEAPKEAPKAAAKAKPAPSPGLVDEFLDNPAALGGLGVVGVLLVGYGAWAWKRKKAAQTRFQDSVLGAASDVSAAAGPAAAPQPAPAASVSQASISQASVGGGEGDEVDPIAEADVYMAYGRDAQAEEILKEALQKDANRVAVHVKLAEIFAGRRDAKSLEQSALKVKSLTNGSGAEWDKVAGLGRSVDPQNGLYGGGGGAAPAAGAAAPATKPDDTLSLPVGGAPGAPTLDFDIGGAAAAPAAPEAGAPAAAEAPAPALDFDLGSATTPAAQEKSDFTTSGTLIIDSKEAPAEAPAAGGGLDFDLGAAAPAAASAPASGGLDFELPGAAPAAAAPEAPAAVTAAAAADTGTINFDLNLDAGGAKAEPAAAPAPVDISSISLDLGAPGEAAAAPSTNTDPKWQEVATKLDLAKAYEEMGDKDGARELLNEVLKEGDSAQQGQAKQMLSALG